MSGEKNSFTVSTGSLVHHQIQIVGLGYTWVFEAPLTREDLVSEYAYYLYAKCSKSALTAEWVLSDEQISVEEIMDTIIFILVIYFQYMMIEGF